MYICTECGAQYKEKPEFCDCGNDTFEEVNGVNVSDSSVTGGALFYPKEPLNKSEILSRVIFAVFMVLSVLVLLFFPKITPKPEQQQNPVVVNEHHSDIPDISSFWIDSKPQVVEEPVQEPFIVNEVKKITQVIVKQRPEPKKIEVKTVKNKQAAVKQQVVKPQSSKSQTQSVAKPIQQPVVKPKPAPSRSLDYAMLNYRSALRMKLLSNLNMSEVDGTGKCGIEFAVDSTGKLTERGFTFRSDNTSVNDAIYKMLMRTPYFNPPPDSYDGRKFKLTFSLGNGSYEISFVD